MANIKPAQSTFDFIKENEGFTAKEIPDAKTGKTQIGYGFNYAPKDKPMSKGEADVYFNQRLGEATRDLNSDIKVDGLTQGQIDVLYDLHYNLGRDGMKEIVQTINSGKIQDVPAQIKLYNKALNTKTGQKEVLQNLVDRREKSALRWGSQNFVAKSNAPAMPTNTDALFEGADAINNPETALFDGADSVDADPLFDGADEVETMMAQEVNPERKTSARLDNMSDIAVDQKEIMIRQEAKRVAAQTGMKVEDVEADLEDMSGPEIMERHARGITNTFFPSVSKWGGKAPENYVMLRDNGTMVKKVEVAADSLKANRSEMTKMVDSALRVPIERSRAHFKILTGEMTQEDGIKVLEQLDQDTVDNQFEDTAGMQKLSKAIDDLDFNSDSIINFLQTVWDEKDVAALQTGQVVTQASPMIALTLAGTATGNPVGGALAGGAVAAVNSWGDRMQQLMEEFRDPETGKIDYRKALSDPARVKKWRESALIYAGVMGAVEAVWSRAAGKFTKTAFKAVAPKSVAGKVAAGAAGLAGETVLGGVEEAAGEYGGLTASDFYLGKLDAKKNKENLKAAKQEGIMGMGAGTVFGGLGAGTDFIVDSKERAAHKTAKIVKDSEKANNDVIALSTLRGVRDALGPEVSAETEDLLNDVLKPEDNLQGENPTFDVESDLATDIEVDRMARDAKENVMVSPREFVRYHETIGLNYKDALQNFPTDLQQEFIKSLETDSSIHIPVAEWLKITASDPVIDGIVRMNGNSHNALEANENLEGLEKDPMALFHKAWHGTPHDFEKFSTKKIGTGEGAQAYGHGLYFTEDQEIAEWYREKLTGTLKGKVKSIPDNLFSVIWSNNAFGYDTATQFLADIKGDKNWQNNYRPEDFFNYEADVKAINDFLETADLPPVPSGQLYEVDIQKEKSHMLDWHKKLIEQDPYVQDKLAMITHVLPAHVASGWNFIVGDSPVRPEDMNGEDVYRALKNLEGSDKRASAVLRELGIPGIRYRANTPRVTPEGYKHENMVVFHDEDVKIDRKLYSKVGDPTDGGDDTQIEIIEPTEADGNIISRPVHLYDKFRSKAEKKIFQEHIARMKAVSKEAREIDPVSLEFVAELHLRHMRQRADSLGKPIEEIANLKWARMTKKEATPKGGYVVLGFFSPRNFLIALNKERANLTTVIHELGHSYLHEMALDYETIFAIPEDKLNESQREYKAAMEIFAKEFNMDNVGNLFTLDDGRYEKIHETFAQTTEKYFLEGKFEHALSVVMEHLRKYMQKIAHSVGTAYKQYPPKIISPEIETMFEGILGVSAKVDDTLIPMFPEPLFPLDMLGAEGKRYREAWMDARSAAIGKFYGKAFTVGMRERDKIVAAAMKDIQARAEETVSQRPSQQFSSQMEEAFNEYNSDTEGDVSDPRFSFESVARALNLSDDQVTELKKTIPKHMMNAKKKGGQDLAVYMHLNGISDPGLMMEILVETGMKDDMVMKEMDKLIARDFPILKTDDEIHKEAEKALNDGGIEKLLKAEIDMLIEKAREVYKGTAEKLINPATYINKSALPQVRAHATQLILGSRVEGFSSKNHLVDSQRHGRQAARAFKSNDIISALDSKYLEAVHFQKFKFAQIVERVIAKIHNTSVEITSYRKDKEKLKEYDTDILDFGAKVILSMAQNKDIPLMDPSNFSKFSGVNQALVDAVNLEIGKLHQLTKNNFGRNTTVDTFLQYGAVINKIKKVAKLAKTIELDGRKLDYQKTIDGFLSDLSKNNSVVTMDNWYRRSFRNINAIFESFYESPEAYAASTPAKALAALQTAEAQYGAAYDTTNEALAAAIQEAVKNDSNMNAILSPILTRVGARGLNIADKPVISPPAGDDGMGELGVTFNNMAEVHFLNMLCGSFSGARRALIGGFNGQRQMAVIDPSKGEHGELDMARYERFRNRLIEEGKLTKEHFDMYQKVWDLARGLHPQLRDSVRRADGVTIGFIEGWDVKTPWGTYKGGYVPISVKKDLKKQMTGKAGDPLLDPDDAGFGISNLYPTQNMKNTLSRDTDSDAEISLDMSKLNTYFGAVLKIIHLRNPLIDFGRVMAHPEVKQQIEARRPGFYGDGGAKSVIYPWFQDVKGQVHTKPATDGFDFWAGKLRNNVSTAFYFMNLGTVLRQQIGHIPAMAATGPSYWINSNLKQAANPKQTAEFIAERDPWMAERMKTSQKNFVRDFEALTTNFDWITQAQKGQEKLVWMGIQASQNLVDRVTWMAAFDKGLDMGLTEAQAVIHARNVVKKTQGSSSVSDLANIQRGSPVKKLVSMISSLPIAINNWRHTESARDVGHMQKTKAIALVVISGMMLPVIMDQLATEALKGMSNEEEDKDKRRLSKRKDASLTTRAMLSTVEYNLPIISRPLTGLVLFDDPSISPGMSKAGRAAKGTYTGLTNKYKGIDLSTNEIKSMSDMFTVVTGIGTSAIGKVLDINDNYVEGKQEYRKEKILDKRVRKGQQRVAKTKARRDQ